MRFFHFLLVLVFTGTLASASLDHDSWRLWPDSFKSEFQSSSSTVSQFFRVADSVLFAWNGRLCEFHASPEPEGPDPQPQQVHVFAAQFAPRWNFKPLITEDGQHAYFMDTSSPLPLATLYRVDPVRKGDNETREGVIKGGGVELVSLAQEEAAPVLANAINVAEGKHVSQSAGSRVYFVDRVGLREMGVDMQLRTLHASPSHGMVMGILGSRVVGYGPSMDETHLHDNCVWAFDLHTSQYEVLYEMPRIDKDTMHPVTRIEEDRFGEEELLFSCYELAHGRWLVYRTNGKKGPGNTELVAEMCQKSMSPFRCLGVFLSDAGGADSSRKLLAYRGGVEGDSVSYFFLEDSTMFSSTRSLKSEEQWTQRRFERARGVFSNAALLRSDAGTSIIYSGVDEELGREVWICDGRQSRMVGDLAEGPTDSRVQVLGSLGSRVLLAAFNLIGDGYYWITDGTNRGTYEVHEMNMSPERVRAVRVAEDALLVPTGSLVNLRPVLVEGGGDWEKMYAAAVPDHIRAGSPPAYTEKEGAWLRASDSPHYYVYASYEYGGYTLETGTTPRVLRLPPAQVRPGKK